MKKLYALLSVLCLSILVLDPAGASAFLGQIVQDTSVVDIPILMANALAPSYVDGVGWTPDRAEKWSKIYHVEHEQYKVFNETYTGVSWSRRGPSKSDLVTAAPIKVDTSLVSGGYIKKTEMDSPLYSDSKSRLNSGRLRQQKRTGHENETNKRYLATPLALWFDSVKIKDSEISEQELATGEIITRLEEQLSRHTAHFKDDEHLVTLNSGYPQFVYRTIGEVSNAADGATVTADAGMGVYTPPTEHPNSFVFANGEISEITYSATQATHSANILTALTNITTSDKPGLVLLNKINTYVKTKKIAGVEVSNKGRGHSYVILLVSPKFMSALKMDSDFQTLYNNSHMGFGYEHPLIMDGDIKYENLIIRSEEKLLDPQFKASVSYNGTGAAGDAAIGSATDTVWDVSGSGEDKDVQITWGTRSAGTGLAGSSLDQYEKFYLLGADSMVYVPGNPYNIGPRDTNDYGRITALGCKHIFGIHRTDWMNAAKAITLNQSSAVGYAYIG